MAHTPPDDVLLVERDEDYVYACRELSVTDASTSGLKVWVRSKNHFTWLRDFTEQIGCSVFFSEKTPRLVLAEKWKYPLMYRSLESKCESWAQRSKEAWVKNLCSRIFENTGDLWQWLSLWACLHGYPEKLLEYVLAPEQVLFVRNIPVEAVYDLPLEPAPREQILTQIELLFDEIQSQVTSGEEFRKVLGWTSGRLFQEYHFISKMLGSRQFSPTTEDVQQVQAKFRHCPGVSESSLISLRHCIAPSPPRLIGPDEKWDSAAWIKWTTEEYTPYRTWQIYNKQYEEELEHAVARFSDWFIEEYTAIHKDPNLSLAHCLADISLSGSENQLSIILLVDCLPLEFAGLLDDALRNVGYSRHVLRYRFAALPTITEYNKPVLVSGQWQHGPGNYDAILKVRAQADWNNTKVVYLNNLKSLSELPAPQESAVVLLNFLDADELLHPDVESKGTSYDEELHRLFARMAASVDRISTLKLDLVTTCDSYLETELKTKLSELKIGLSKDQIDFDYILDSSIHDRWIEADTGWRIILGRGLDIFQKPDDKFTLGFMDQTKRKCKATTITYTSLRSICRGAWRKCLCSI